MNNIVRRLYQSVVIYQQLMNDRERCGRTDPTTYDGRFGPVPNTPKDPEEPEKEPLLEYFAAIDWTNLPDLP